MKTSSPIVFRQLVGSKDPALPYSSDPAVRNAEATTSFDDNEDDLSILADDVVNSPNKPLSEPVKVAAEDFKFAPNECDEEHDEAEEHDLSEDVGDQDDGIGPSDVSAESDNDCLREEMSDYDQRDHTPSISNIDDGATHSPIVNSNSVNVSSVMRAYHIENSYPTNLVHRSPAPNLKMDASTRQGILISPTLQSPVRTGTAHLIVFDIAMLGGMNPAAVASPIKPDKSTLKKVTANHMATTEPAKAVAVRPQEHASSACTSLRPQHTTRAPPRYDKAGSDGSGIEAEPRQKKRKTKAQSSHKE